MRKARVYIEYSFWKQMASGNSIDSMRSFIEVFDLLVQSEVCLDITAEQLAALAADDPQLLMLWKRAMSGQLEMELGTDQRKNAVLSGSVTDIADLMAVFLLDRGEKFCHALADRIGVMALNVSMARNQAKYFDGDGVMVQRGMQYNDYWLAFAQKLKQVCNSLVVVDPYLCRDRQTVEVNLLSLLDAVLPMQLAIPFHLSIFTITNTPNHGAMLQRLLVDRLASIRPQISFELSVYQITRRDRFHDRYLISNNVLIGCGAGFDLFDEQGYAGKDTKVDVIYPHMQNHTVADTEAYWRFLEVTKRAHLRAFSRNGMRNFWGPKVNRLFDAVEVSPSQHQSPQRRQRCPSGQRHNR